MTKSIRLLTLPVLGAMACGVAAASTLDSGYDPYYHAAYWFGGLNPIHNISTPGSLSDAVAGSSMSYSLTGLPDAAVSFSGAANGGYLTGNVRLNYWFQVSGPAGPVPVLFDTDVSLSLSQVNNAFADLSIWNGIPSFAVVYAQACFDSSFGCNSVNPNGTQSHQGTLSATLDGGGIYEVSLSAGMTIPGYFAAGSGSAYVRHPYIYIDPNFSGAGQYSLTLSQGVSNDPLNQSATPEPGALSLALAGSLVLVALRRLRA